MASDEYNDIYLHTALLTYVLLSALQGTHIDRSGADNEMTALDGFTYH